MNTEPVVFVPVDCDIFRLVSPDGTAGILVVSVAENEIDMVTPGWSIERMEIESVRHFAVLDGEKD
jgi:hypothetical protein